MQDRNEYLNQLIDHNPGDEAITNTDVPRIELALTVGPVWKVAGLWHLSPEQNGGNHHTYADLIDADGALLPVPNTNLLVYDWEGMQPEETPPPVAFDKRPPEPSANVPIWAGQHLSTWIEGGAQGAPAISDRVVNLRTDQPGEGGNSAGHHSFYIVWQYYEPSDAGGPEPEPGPGTPSLEERVAALEAGQADLERRVTALENA